MSRRIVQVVVSFEPGAPDNVYAVADDGTLWTTWRVQSANVPWRWREWEQIPALPEPRPSDASNGGVS